MSDRDRFRRVFRLPGRLGRKGDAVDEELSFHIQALVDDLSAEGMDGEEAWAEARRRFGNVAAVRDECRRIGRQREGMMRIADAVDTVRQDVGFSLRQLVRQPVVGALAFLTLVLGVGATAVVFSVVNAVVLRPLPFQDPDGLVRVRQVTPQGSMFSVSEPNFVDYRARQRSFTELGGLGFGSFTLTGSDEPESVSGMRLSHTVLPILGMRPVAGRNFRPEEDVKDAGDVVLLSEGAWLRRFGGDPGVVGTALTLNGIPREVVGVIPSERAWPGVEVFMPLGPEPVLERDNSMIEVLGRLAPGVTLEEARADVAGIGQALAAEYPEMRDWGATAISLRELAIGPRLTRLGYFLLGAVGLLLLMACVSISNIQVARATARLHEMGIRAALGAGRRRILAQLTTEALFMAVLGGGAAVALTYWALPQVRRLGPSDVARLSEATVDGTVLAVAVGAAVLAVLVSGLAPMVLILRSGLFQALRAGAVPMAGHGRRLRSALVASQFALAVVVVLGAGLMVRSFVLLQEVDLGFEPAGLVRFSLRLPDNRFPPEERGPFLGRLQDEIVAIPGVEAMGVTMAPPFSPFRPSNFVASSDNEPDRQEDFVPVSWRGIRGDYFAAAGIPLLAGREFDEGDRPPDDATDLNGLPIIVDRALAERLFPDGSDPLGRGVTWNQPGGFHATVVGVVASARDEWVDAEPRPRVYLPYEFAPWGEPTVLVRATGDPGALIAALRSTVASVDPDMPVIEALPVGVDLRETVAWPRFTMQVLSVFGMVALLLAGMGIYGVTAFTVARRRQEIGVRVALGAKPGEVMRLVLRQSLALAAAGITVGLAAAALLTRFLESLLYDISATDPMTFALVPLVLAAAALAAAWVPARRAVKVDPREALVAE